MGGHPGGHRPQRDPTVRGCRWSTGWGLTSPGRCWEGGTKGRGRQGDPHRGHVGAHAGMGPLGFTSTRHCRHPQVEVRPIHPPDPISISGERSPPPHSPLQPPGPPGTAQPTYPTCPFSLPFARGGIFPLRFVFSFLGVPQHKRKRHPKQKGRPQEGVPHPRSGGRAHMMPLVRYWKPSYSLVVMERMLPSTICSTSSCSCSSVMFMWKRSFRLRMVLEPWKQGSCEPGGREEGDGVGGPAGLH